MHVPLRFNLQSYFNRSILEAESSHSGYVLVCPVIGAFVVNTCHPCYSPKHLQCKHNNNIETQSV